MPEKSQNLLVNFMKKQASDKVSKQNISQKSSASLVKSEREKKAEEEAEKLQEAKKESRGKAENYDQSGMIKKLIIENVAKYVLIIGLLVGFALAIIQAGPFIGGLLHGMINNILMSGMK